MAKLRDLINESKFLKREFGEPLPTFKGVMKQHQINKLEEGWWDNMSDKAQAAYIKKYGEAPDANGEDEYPDKDPINTKKGEMEDEMEDIANELDNVTDPDEKKELEDRYDKIDQELYDINKKQYGDDSGYEKSGRTGKELDQETLTIDGKQYSRISEGVEKQSKPKYEFSEFYQRFKR